MSNDQALEKLRSDGYLILRDVLPSAVVEHARSALRPLLDRQPWGKGEFFGGQTKRVHNILAKTRAVDAVVCHPAVLDLVRSMLTAPQVSIVNAIEVHPGETAQFLHQDDVVFPIARPHPPVIVNTMWALTEFTAENGATRLVPGSQDATELDADATIVTAEMEPGSVLIWDGGLFHGAGANRGRGPRLGLNVNYNCAWLRQQENQYLAIPAEIASTLADDFLRLLGYDAYIDIYGLVDHRHPLGVLGRDVAAIASGGGDILAGVATASGETPL
ncbi:phytanoyl-CoA dioxygenase family protein [Mycobacterium sp.]|uniref:phytanoyl-CoA dioxygenase family protein n=1 Tax=Mycobacterium sp. TaxID=1785 RepID=UPI00127E0D86|nr:phytanoyl-CoA dioxygenase family protein [Mycobacterium sp.]KAA8964524.1 MAG: phytanoyl-CoA dioxygenase family protein [Mycobacterium sp.]